MVKKSIRLINRSKLYITIASLLISSSAMAAGTVVQELTRGSASTAGAGASAISENAVTAYSNPAGMAFLEDDTTTLGIGAMFLNVRYNSDSSYNASSVSNAGNTQLYGSNYFVKTLGENWRLGLSLGSQGGSSLDYGLTYDGRAKFNNVSLKTMQFNPSVSYKINNQFSIGFGAQIEYASLDENMMLDDANAHGHDVSFGWNLGLLYKIDENNRIGFSYRSQIKHKINTNFTSNNRSFDNPLIATVVGGITDYLPQSGSVSILVPNQAELSGVHRLVHIDPKLTFLWSLGYEGWGKYHETQVYFDNPTANYILNANPIEVSTKRYFHDIWQVATGVHYQLYPSWRLEFGLAYSSSINDTDKPAEQDFDMPNHAAYKMGLGTTYTINKNASLNFYYEYLNYGKPRIEGVDPIRGVYNGRFNNDNNLFGMMFNWTF